MSWPYADNPDNANRLLKQTKRIIKMYLLWTLIYFPLAVYNFISSGTSPIDAVLSYLRGFLFVGENYNSWQLWYLLSTIYTLLILYIIIFKIKKSSSVTLILMSVIASIIMFGVSALAAYEGEMPALLHIAQKLVSCTCINGRIFSGMIYIPVGMLLAKKQIPFIVNLILFILGFISNLFISYSIVSNYLMIITAIALFGIIKKIELKNRVVYPILRNMSTTVYLIHMYIWTFYYTIAYGEKTSGLDSFLVTSIISVLFFFIVGFVKKYLKNKKNLKT